MLGSSLVTTPSAFVYSGIEREISLAVSLSNKIATYPAFAEENPISYTQELSMLDEP